MIIEFAQWLHAVHPCTIANKCCYSSVLNNRPVTLGPDSLLTFEYREKVSRESGPNVTGLLLSTLE